MHLILSLCAVLILTVTSVSALALETDQFTLPPTPLTDSGPVISKKFYRSLISAENATDPAAAFYGSLGRGLPTSTVENWVNSAPELNDGGRFKLKPSESIYAGVRSPIPFALDFLAPTINMYGVYFGTDKLGHFVQQGYGYFKIFERETAAGRSPTDALAAAVRTGVREENSYYGTMLTGVYSNGDLAADVAGLFFYLNMTKPVTVNGVEIEPIFLRDGAHWKINETIDPEKLLMPFITIHLSEALNPSVYLMSKSTLKENIEARCPQWKSNLGKFSTVDTRTWNGLDYGHRDSHLTLPLLCRTGVLRPGS